MSDATVFQGLGLKRLSKYIAQYVQRLWLHPSVTCSRRLSASLGGRNILPT
jgi:hypothetical protein